MDSLNLTVLSFGAVNARRNLIALILPLGDWFQSSAFHLYFVTVIRSKPHKCSIPTEMCSTLKVQLH